MFLLSKNRIFCQKIFKIKKLVLVSVNPVLRTEANIKNIILNKVSYIYFLLYFYKNKKNKVQAIIEFDNKINARITAYTLKLDIRVYCTNIRV